MVFSLLLVKTTQFQIYIFLTLNINTDYTKKYGQLFNIKSILNVITVF